MICPWTSMQVIISRMKSLAVLALASSTALLLAACGSDSDTASDGESSAATAGAPVSVAAAFYPLAFLVEQVGGDRVELSDLTAPGTEPHDLELAADALVTLEEADLVVFQEGFQPAVDDALAARDGNVLDLSPVATRTLGQEEAPAQGEEAEYKPGLDPHFWNDPSIYADAAMLVADALVAADPEGEDAYRANADALVAELTAIDEEAAEALSSCAITTLVTGHEAFGYFADRYGFDNVPIAGISPEAEPSASALAEVTDIVRAKGVTTIYTETLAAPDIAETVAAETGAKTAVLDPLEGITDQSAGTDYPSIMRVNIDAVVAGQQCL